MKTISYETLNDLVHDVAVTIFNHTSITIETEHLYRLNDTITAFLQDAYGVTFEDRD